MVNKVEFSIDERRGAREYKKGASTPEEVKVPEEAAPIDTAALENGSSSV